MVRIPQTSFARGEISPALYPMQNDVTRQGCVELENAIITENGGVKKRTGFAHNAFMTTDTVQLIAAKFDGVEVVIVLKYIDADSRVALNIWQPSAGAFDAGAGIIDDFNDVFLQGWDEADVAQIQYVISEDAVYVVSTTGNAPPYRIGRRASRTYGTNTYDPTDLQWWEVKWLGEDQRIGDAPIYKNEGPPFALTISADGRAGGPTAQNFFVESPEPIFSQEDEDSVRPWMFTYPEDGNSGSSNVGTPVWAYCVQFVSPTQAFFQQFSENSGGTFDDISDTPGQTLDWYGPWTSSTSTGTVSVSSLAHTTLMTVTFASSAEANNFAPGDIINLSGGTFTHCAILTYRSGSTTFDAFMLANDGTTGSTGLTVSRWVPDTGIQGLDLYTFGGTTGNFFRLFSQFGRFYGDMTTQSSGIERPGLQLEYNGGLVQASGNGADAYNQFQFEQIEGVTSFYPTTLLKWRGDKENGWPTAIEFHQDRLFLSGNDGASVVASRTGRYDQWSLGSDADDALLFKVAAGRNEKVKWLASAGDLLIGTDVSEYAMSGALTPTNVGVDRQSNYGGSSVQPVKIDGQVLFVEADGETVRATNYRYETEQYVAQSITDMAEHIFDGNPIQQMVLFAKPDRIVLAILDDGDVVALSYRPEAGIMGWSRWVGLENFKSMTVQRGSVSDTVYAAHSYNTECVATWPSTYYLDYWESKATIGASKVHDDLLHLEGLPVQALVDGDVYVGLYTVSSGEITLLTATNPLSIQAGQLINFQMIPFPPETVDRGSGTTLGQRKTYQMARVRVRLSRDVRVADRLLDSTNMPADTINDPDPPTSAPPLKGGWYTVRALGKAPDDETPPKFESLAPYLCEFNAVVLDVDFGTE